jgi:uncharacterized protein YehS (DUF1456 family)
LKTNNILKKLCDIEKLDKEQAYEVFKLSGYDLTKDRVEGYLSDDDSKEFLDCGYEALGSFLDGLIIHKRGESNSKKNDTPISLNNNLILKKLRIAYELKEVDLYQIFNTVEIDITKGELNSLFRKEDHKNYRACPDSILSLFLDGLVICEGDI